MFLKRFVKDHVILILSILLFFAGLSCLALYFSGRSLMQEGYGQAYGKMLFRILLTAVAAVLSWLIAKNATTKQIIRSALPIFIIIILISFLFPSINNRSDNWIYIAGLSFYLPAFMYLGILLLAYYASKYRKISNSHLLYLGIFVVGIPFLVTLVNYHSLDVGITLALTSVILSIKMCFDRRLSKSWIIFLLIMIVGMPVFLFYGPYYSARLDTIINAGQNDPNGSGFFYIKLAEAVSSINFFSRSRLMIDSVPAYAYFTIVPNNTDLLVLALYGGWILLILVLAIDILLIVSIYRQCGKATNSFSEYLCFSIASLFAAKTFLSIVSNFILAGTIALPFFGNASFAAVDSFLLTLAVTISQRDDQSAEDIIDLENSTSEYLSSLYSRLVEAITIREESDDYLEDDFENEYDNGFPTEPVNDLLRNLKRDERLYRDGKLSSLDISKRYSALFAEGDGTAKKREKVFISYATEDLKYAQRLCHYLEEKGIPVWYYTRDLTHGSFPVKIIQAMRESVVFVVLVSQHSNASEHVWNEVGVAFTMKKEGMHIMPLILENVDFCETFVYYLTGEEHSDATRWPVDYRIKEFADRIEAVINTY